MSCHAFKVRPTGLIDWWIDSDHHHWIQESCFSNCDLDLGQTNTHSIGICHHLYQCTCEVPWRSDPRNSSYQAETKMLHEYQSFFATLTLVEQHPYSIGVLPSLTSMHMWSFMKIGHTQLVNKLSCENQNVTVTYGRMDKVKPVYPPTTIVAGLITRASKQIQFTGTGPNFELSDQCRFTK